MTCRERAQQIFDELYSNGDVNLSDSFMEVSPQIVERIKNTIELGLQRQVEEVRSQLLADL